MSRKSDTIELSIAAILLILAAIYTPIGESGQNTVGFAFSTAYPGYAAPYSYGSVNTSLVFNSASDTATRSVDVNDDIVYRTGYVSYDGSSWTPFDVSPGASGNLNVDWINTKGTVSISFSPAQLGLSSSKLISNNTYIIIYSCSKNTTAKNWSCHEGWQIVPFNAKIVSSNNSSLALYCGDGKCNNGETCSNCSTDCGTCQLTTNYTRTFYVSSSTGSDTTGDGTINKPWKTISKVNSITFKPGDGIQFNKGDIWKETLTVSYSGDSSSPITYGTYGKGANPLIDGANSIDRCITLTGRSYITIDGIDCKNARSNGIASPSSPGTHIIIKNLKVSNIGTTDAEQDGIFQQGGYLTVDNCTITQISRCGIMFGGGHNTIINNHVSYTNLYYTTWGAGINGNGDGDVIAYNVIDHCGGVGFIGKTHGIYVELSNGEVHHNTITNQTRGDGIKSTGSGNFHHNYISGSSHSGIEAGTNGKTIGGPFTVNIYYNIFTGNRQGVSESDQGSVGYTLNIYNNIFYYDNSIQADSYYSEISIEQNVNTALVIKNNILFGYGRYTYAFNAAQSHATINNNVVYQASGNLIYYNGATRTWSSWQGMGFDTEGFNANPLFVDSANIDFHLQSKSPAINSGANVGLTRDYEGNTVPYPTGGAPDIGAYEYIGTALPTCTDTCASLGYQCGNRSVCGSNKNCGTCLSNQTCTNNICVNSTPGQLRLTFSFTKIPSTDVDIVAPGRGAENWNGLTWDDSKVCRIPAGNPQALDSYVRLNWNEIETATQGVYDWTTFDKYMNRAIDAGQKFSFGIMTAYPGEMAYPAYLHTLMQAETTKDWQSSGTWVPNWNSANYLNRYSALLQAIATHLNTASRNGVSYKNAVGYIDIRGYGNYGEWHLSPFLGTPATSTSLRTIIDAHKNAFPNYQLVAMVAGYYQNSAGNTPTDITYYLLTTNNSRGEIGWRRDQWGDSGMDNVLQNNPGSYSGVAFKSIIMDKWRYAPVLGETQNTGEYSDLDREILLYHATSFGNGNYPSCTAATRTAVTASSKDSGYRLILEGGGVTSPLTHGAAFQISLDWKNIGISPTYEDWNVVFELRNGNGNAVWSGTSSFNPRLFLPSSTATTITDSFVLPSSIITGSYKIYIIIKDPNGYRKSLPLAITGRNTDGSYLLGSILVN